MPLRVVEKTQYSTPTRLFVVCILLPFRRVTSINRRICFVIAKSKHNNGVWYY